MIGSASQRGSHDARILARVFVIVLAVICGPATAQVSGQVPGQDDPRFEAAVATWLADDEAAALPALAGLAADGNIAAQVLLALIDARRDLEGPWLAGLAGLPREERLALLRRPGGMSGRRWMEAAGVPLAQLWLDRWSSDTAPATVLGFAAMGEARAARETLLAMAARLRRGFGDLAEAPGYPPALRYLAWAEWATEPGGAAHVAAEIAALPPGDPQVEIFTGEPADPAARDAWLAADPLAAPLRAFCAATCPEAAAGCARAGSTSSAGCTGWPGRGRPPRR
jgi:hypothetical protein